MKKHRKPIKPFSVRRQERKSRKKFIFAIFITGLLAYLLFFWILPTFIGSLSVINRFKPPIQSETSISENPTLAPPVLNIPYEATNTATINIRGYALPNSKVEIYLDDELKSTTSAKEDGSFISDDISLGLGTNNIYGKTIDDKDGKSLPSKTIRITYTNEKPTLDVKEPQDNQVTKDKKVTVSGNVSSKSSLDSITVSVNGTRAIVNSEGNFSQVIEINEGDNNIIITAADQTGNSTQVTRKITFQP